MRKSNKPMRISALLLTLVLVTSCFVGGTFAKYTTSGEGKDSARVAKWGVKVTATGTTFAKGYNEGGSASEENITGTIVNSDEKVVAPGTKGTMAAVTIDGNPEVAVKVSNEAIVSLTGNWSVTSGVKKEFYCPLKFTVTYGDGTTNAEINGLEYTQAADLQNAIAEAVKVASAEFKPGELSLNSSKANVTIGWEWPFEGATQVVTAAGEARTQDNTKDTVLGNKADTTNTADGGVPTISLTVTTKVEQINKAPTP